MVVSALMLKVALSRHGGVDSPDLRTAGVCYGEAPVANRGCFTRHSANGVIVGNLLWSNDPRGKCEAAALAAGTFGNEETGGRRCSTGFSISTAEPACDPRCGRICEKSVQNTR